MSDRVSPPELVRDGGVISLRGAMTLAHARMLSDAGIALLQPADVVVDLQAATEVDSSALAVLFSWQRAQRALGGTLTVRGAPEALQSLARVYGVDQQFGWA